MNKVGNISLMSMEIGFMLCIIPKANLIILMHLVRLFILDIKALNKIQLDPVMSMMDKL